LAVQLAVVNAAQRDSELVADLAAKGARLHETKMVGITGLPATNQTRHREVLRLRRLKANLMAATAYQGLEKVLEPLLEESGGWLPEEWAQRKPRAIKQVERILKSAGLTADAIMAHTLTESLDQFERIERMIAMAEARRNAALHELERHRAVLANTLRPTVEQIEEAEFEVVDRNRPKGAGRHD
jgi:hypothetical protein